MKTQIIQLSPTDDIISVRDKMSWCQTGRILLVWPAHGRAQIRQLDLILAKRYAASLGSQLAVATQDDEVRFDAQQIGIPAFTDSRQAQEQEWEISQQKQIERQPRSNLRGIDDLRKSIQSHEPVWMDQPTARILCLGLSLLAILAMAIFILPGAKISLSPREEMQSIKLDLVADPSSTTFNISTGSLPTYNLEIIVDGTDEITATGEMMIPDKPATGMLKFSNRTRGEISLPAGTIVSTVGSDRVRFITSSLDDIVIKPNKSVLVETQALKTGTSGNLPANSLVTIEGDLGLDLAVTNPEATSGGLDASVPTPTTQDLQTLRQRLTTRLLQKALAELKSDSPANDTLIQASAVISEVMDESFTPASGVPAEKVELTLRLKIKAQVVSGAVLRNMAIPILDAAIPVGYTPVMNTFNITLLTEPTMGAEGKAYWVVNASRKLKADIPSGLALESIKGATTPDAVERLSASLPLAEPAQIVITPAWWPRLPLLAMRITFVQADTQ